MFTLAFYDVTGIQRFVFGSSKAAEIVGASAIVQRALEKWLVESVRDSCPGAATEWSEYSTFPSSDSALPAEIIYIGGGNAMVAFFGADETDSRKSAVATTRRLSRKVFEETRGTLQVAVAYLPGSSDFAADKRHLQQDLARVKAGLVSARPLMGIGITAEGSTDGLPAEHLSEVHQPEKPTDTTLSSMEGPPVERVFLSGPAQTKRDQSKAMRDYERLMPDSLNRDYAFPIKFDDLWQRKGENHIAVVHIDGNGMGNIIERATENVQRMRRLSFGIATAYEESFKETVERIADGLKDETFLGLFGIKDDADPSKTLLPVRPLVFSGDDVTFVCDGRLGIWFATEMLKGISKHSINEVMPDDTPIPLSACAGVAIVKSHFPFARAYYLAEDLCKSAKAVAKASGNGAGNTVFGSWMDFHIVYSGITQDLSDLPSSSYNVPGMTEATAVHSECTAYNLLGRPWEVAPPNGKDAHKTHNWATFAKIYDNLKKSWPRSRLKDMRDVMIHSEQETNEYLQECKSRGFTLPGLWNLGGERAEAFTREHATPYFDALELLDFYVRPPEPEGVR